jgi:hypothetical protein
MNEKELKKIAHIEYKRDKDIFNLGYKKAREEDLALIDLHIKLTKEVRNEVKDIFDIHITNFLIRRLERLKLKIKQLSKKKK